METWMQGAVGLAVAVALATVLWASGARVRRLARLPAPPSLAPVVEFLTGSLVVATAVLALGLLGRLTGVWLAGLVVAAAATGRYRGISGAARRMAWPLAASAPLLAVALAPPFFYDSWVYHLGLPWQALLEGGLRPHPEMLFSSFPPLARLLYTLPLAAGADRAPALLHLIAFAFAASAAAGLARRLGAGRPAAGAVAACVPYLATAPLVPAFPASEAWTLGGVLCAVALAVGPSRRGVAATAGLAAGVAVAGRLQGLVWAAIVVALLVRHRRPRPVVAALASVVVGAAPWWVANLALLGDPLAPIGWSRPGIETLWRDASSSMHLAGSPPELARVAFAALASHAGWLVLVGGIAIVAAGISRRPRIAGAVLVALAGAAAWSLTGALGRFLAPVFAILLAAACSGRRPVGSVLAGIAVTVTVLPGLLSTVAVWREIGGPALLGDEAAVLAAVTVDDPSPGFAACESLPPDAVVLLVAEPRGFRFPRRFVTTSQHDPSLLAAALERANDPRAAVDLLEGQGFTHVLVHVPELQRLAPDYPVEPWTDAAGRDRFVAWTRLLGTPVVSEGGMVVYALDRLPADSGEEGEAGAVR